MPEAMHYFRAVKGRAFRRPGTDSFIGAVRRPSGFDINPDVVVRIPETEMRPYRKDYRQALAHGDLHPCTEEDFKQYQERRAQAAATASRVRALETKRREAQDSEAAG